MLDLIGETLPHAAAIAISPIPIIAVILMLMSSRSRQLGGMFLLGWVLGVLVATSAFTLLADVIPEPAEEGSQPVMGVIQIALGIGLLLLGLRQWRSRPGPGTTPELPAWMTKIDSMKVLAAFGLAFALAAVNPKNLLVAAAAGAVIGRADLDVIGITVTIAIFVLVASLTVLVPVLFTVVAPKSAAEALVSIRTWLTLHNAAIMTVLFAVLGVQVLGKGLGAF